MSKTKELWKHSKKVFGLSVVLELQVENSTILTFKVIFLCQNRPNLSDFFIEEHKKEEKLWFLMYTLFTKNGPNLWPLILKQWKCQKYFYVCFHTFFSCLFTTKIRSLQKNNIGHTTHPIGLCTTAVAVVKAELQRQPRK